MIFWDCSALVALVVEDSHSSRAVELYSQDSKLFVWWGSELECISAISRLEREGKLESSEARKASELLEELRINWYEVLPSEKLKNLGRRLLRVHPLRAADAVQLAAAVLAAEEAPQDCAFVSFDRRLVEAAEKEGFRLA